MALAKENQLYNLIAQVFGVPPESVNDESSPDNIPTWDSLSHINLVLSLEQEFGISLTPDAILEMMSVRLIRLILEEHGVTSVA